MASVGFDDVPPLQSTSKRLVVGCVSFPPRSEAARMRMTQPSKTFMRCYVITVQAFLHHSYFIGFPVWILPAYLVNTTHMGVLAIIASVLHKKVV